MHWMDEVKGRLKRKNQILFGKSSEFLQDLSCLMQAQSHQTMVLWAFEFADETAEKLTARYPGEKRFGEAIAAARGWASGIVKMPFAQRAILQVHAVAKENHSPEDIALCHAIGQACGVVHTTGHAIGFAIYDLTAIIRQYGVDACQGPAQKRMEQYIQRLHYWRNSDQARSFQWADFMMTDSPEGPCLP